MSSCEKTSSMKVTALLRGRAKEGSEMRRHGRRGANCLSAQQVWPLLRHPSGLPTHEGFFFAAVHTMRAISCRTRAAPRTSLAASPRPLVSSRVGSSETVARHRRLFATAPIACSRRLVPAFVSHHPLALSGTLPSAQRQTLHNGPFSPLI